MTFQQTKKQITIWGGLIIFIYLSYVIAFPLTPYIYYEGNILDLEMILRNGHNEMMMIAFITLGLILYQKNQWLWATVAFTFACLIKLPAPLIFLVFGLSIFIMTPFTVSWTVTLSFLGDLVGWWRDKTKFENGL